MKIKSISFIVLIAICIGLFSFNTEEKNDKKLVGIWKGFEKHKQIEGVEKHWIQQRFNNGKFVIMFTSVQNCEVETFTEKGKWWTENGKFYEKSDMSENIDIYDYQVIGNEEVKFKSIKLDGADKTDYEFSDFKMND